MIVFRYIGLCFGVGKYLGKVGWNFMVGEVEIILWGLGISILVLFIMFCCLECLVFVLFVGSGRKLGFCGVSLLYCDGFFLGLCLLLRGY